MTEQEKAGWALPYPTDGDQCPECHHGVIEVQEFGDGGGKEAHAWCTGLNGTKLEDADEDDEEGAGCGWSGIYYPNQNEPTNRPDNPPD